MTQPTPTHRVKATPAGFRRRVVSGMLALAAALVATVVSPAAGQIRNLDDARFIQGLRERNMRELLKHFLEINPPKDELLRLEILVETHKLDATDDKRQPAERVAAMEKVLDAYRQLINAAPPTHHKQPLWKTDFTEYAMRTVLTLANLNAGEFAEFGFTTPDQKAAFNRIVPEAWQMMEDASIDHFMMVGDLPRRPDFEEKFANTGFWRMFTEEYGNIKIPYYRAWTTLWAQLLEKPMGNIGEAAGWLNVVSNQQIASNALAELRSLQGRVALRTNKLPEATQFLDQVIQMGAQNKAGEFDVFVARLAKTEVLARQKKLPEALAELNTARELPLVTASPMLLVLSFDREVKITGDKNAYLKLFEHPAAQANRGAIEQFVRSRMVQEKILPLAELEKAEALVVLANVDGMLAQASQLQQQAGELSGDEQKKALEEAGKLLTMARDTLVKLLERPELATAAKAEAMFKLGVAHFQLKSSQEAVETWTKLAAELPQEQIAQNAAANAFIISQDLWKNNQKHEIAIKLFDEASAVLLDKFGPAKMGDDPVSVHWHTRGSFLRQIGRHADAVAAFKKFVELNPGHPLVSDAHYQALLSQQEQLKDPAIEDKQALAEATVEIADKAIKSNEAAAATEQDSKRKSDLRYRAGDAVLRKAEVLGGTIGNPAQAMVLLQDFDGKFGEFEDLLRAKREMMIGFMVAAGRAPEALAEVRGLIQQAPGEGGALINGVLAAVNGQIDNLMLAGRPADARKLADIGVQLGTLLLDWAKQQADFADAAKLMPFQVILARQYYMAERHEDALKIYSELFATEAGKNNWDVILGMARTNYHLKRYQDALPHVNTLLRLGTDKQSEPEWWETWMMRVVILDWQFENYTNGPAEVKSPERAAKTSRTIFTTIEKLKLIDNLLGGPKYKERFQQLQNKHFPR